MMAKQQGFTLIELMIVIAIIAIVSAIAYPSYQDSVRKTNRTEAISALSETAQRLERCATTNGSYTHANCPFATGHTFDTPKGHYTITVEIPTAGTYTLTAEPKSAMQLADKKCQEFSLTHTGKKAAKDESAAESTCW